MKGMLSRASVAFSVFILVISVVDFAYADNELADLIDRIEPSVVKVVVSDGHGGGGLGSGFLVGGGLVVTNRHVIEDGVTAKIVFENGKSYPVGGFVFDGGDMDICIITIKGLPSEIPKLQVRSDLPRKGEAVYTFGAPKGYGFSVSEGIVSALRTFDKDWKETNSSTGQQFIQITAPISPGNSGGPLIDVNGLVVGMNTFTRTDGQNINFSLACNEITACLSKCSDQAQPITLVNSKDPIARLEKYLDLNTLILSQWQKTFADQQALVDQDIVKWSAKLEAAKNDGEKTAISVHLAKLEFHKESVFDEDLLRVPKMYLSNRSSVYVGQYGIAQETIKILQVLGPTDCLVVVGKDVTIYRMAGFNTTNLVDDQIFSGLRSPPFAVVGTWTYTTVRGATSRVFIITPATGLEKTKLELVADFKSRQSDAEIHLDQTIAELTNRKWTSGQFITQANFVRLAGMNNVFTVTLLKADGQEIKLDPQILSPADQLWIKGFKKYQNMPLTSLKPKP
jgi:hypothetical protein